jgi:DNA-binding transcriptional ArsR family regulator
MKEGRYRESRLCRVLGNPIAYEVIVKLLETGPRTPSELADSLGRSVSALSHTLGKLRLAELVRFDRSGRAALYSVKYARETRALLKALEDFVGVSQKRE